MLRTRYGIGGRDVLDTLIELLTRENVELLGPAKGTVVEALVRARGLPGSPLPDALIVATVRDADAVPLRTFDRDLACHGIEIQEP